MRAWIVFFVVFALWLVWCANPSYNAATSEFQMTGMVTFGSLIFAVIAGIVGASFVIEIDVKQSKQVKYSKQNETLEIAKAMVHVLIGVADIVGDKNYKPNLDALKYQHNWDLLAWWKDELQKIQRKVQ